MLLQFLFTNQCCQYSVSEVESHVWFFTTLHGYIPNSTSNATLYLWHYVRICWAWNFFTFRKAISISKILNNVKSSEFQSIGVASWIFFNVMENEIFQFLPLTPLNHFWLVRLVLQFDRGHRVSCLTVRLFWWCVSYVLLHQQYSNETRRIENYEWWNLIEDFDFILCCEGIVKILLNIFSVPCDNAACNYPAGDNAAAITPSTRLFVTLRTRKYPWGPSTVTR